MLNARPREDRQPGGTEHKANPDGVAGHDGVASVMGLCWMNEDMASWLVFSVDCQGDVVKSSDEWKGLWACWEMVLMKGTWICGGGDSWLVCSWLAFGEGDSCD